MKKAELLMKILKRNREIEEIEIALMDIRQAIHALEKLSGSQTFENNILGKTMAELGGVRDILASEAKRKIQDDEKTFYTLRIFKENMMPTRSNGSWVKLSEAVQENMDLFELLFDSKGSVLYFFGRVLIPKYIGIDSDYSCEKSMGNTWHIKRLRKTKKRANN